MIVALLAAVLAASPAPAAAPASVDAKDIPNYHFVNQDGLNVFSVQDAESEWRHCPRPVGRYKSTAWIPGNFLAAGNFSVDIAVSTHVPLVRVHALVKGPVSFEVVDSFDGDSARGDYMGEYPGVVRPIVDWTTEYRPTISSEAPHSLDELAAS